MAPIYITHTGDNPEPKPILHITTVHNHTWTFTTAPSYNLL